MSKYLVVIDPGHYKGYNKGRLPEYFEGDQMWKLSKLYINELEKYKDVTVKNTKKSLEDNSLNAYERGEFAAKQDGYDKVIFLSLHTNAFSSEGAVGTVLFRSQYRPLTQTLGTNIAKAIADALNRYSGVTYSRGCLAWDYSQKDPKYKGFDYHDVTRGTVLNAGNATNAAKSKLDYGFVIEHGFHTNPKECSALMNPNCQKEIAEIAVSEIAKYFKWDKKESQKKSGTTVPNKTFNAGDIIKPVKNISTVNGIKRGRIFGSSATYSIYNDKYKVLGATSESGRTVIGTDAGVIIAAVYAEDLELIRSAANPSAAESPSPSKSESGTEMFKDVKPENWFYTAVKTMKDLGVVEGYPQDDNFYPNKECTRAEVVQMLKRLVESLAE